MSWVPRACRGARASSYTGLAMVCHCLGRKGRRHGRSCLQQSFLQWIILWATPDWCRIEWFSGCFKPELWLGPGTGPHPLCWAPHKLNGKYNLSECIPLEGFAIAFAESNPSPLLFPPHVSKGLSSGWQPTYVFQCPAGMFPKEILCFIA